MHDAYPLARSPSIPPSPFPWENPDAPDPYEPASDDGDDPDDLAAILPGYARHLPDDDC